MERELPVNARNLWPPRSADGMLRNIMDNTTPSPSGFDPNVYLEPAPSPPPMLNAGPIEPNADSALLIRAILFGLGGVIAGAAIYAAFILITHLDIGYLAVGVAWLIAKAMTVGSQGRGGRQYQIAAILLTLVSVAMGNAIMIWWQVKPIAFSAHNLAMLAMYGFTEPFLEFKDSAVSAAIGLFILFIGLRAAWRMTSGNPEAVRHPFSR